MKNRYCKIQGSDRIYLIEQCSNKTVLLSDGNIKIKTEKDKITLLPEDFIPPKRNARSTITVCTDNVPSEIMLRHKLKEEAITELDKYIDQALVAKLGRVRIIHGRHGGILRDAVHEYLSTHPYVKSYEIADYSEGGIGVTVAILGKKS